MSDRRWKMLFVDGENMAIRGSKVASEHGVTLTAGPQYMKDVFIWMPGLSATHVLAQPKKGNQLEKFAIRAHYYTSLVGDDKKLHDVKRDLRVIGFHAQVFKKDSQDKKSKGVDITLTTDMLVNAFHDNYDVAVLIAGDGDYVPVVEELKRMGKTVYVVFFVEECAGLNESLRWSCDKFFKLSRKFITCWRAYGTTTAKGLSKPEREVT